MKCGVMKTIRRPAPSTPTSSASGKSSSRCLKIRAFSSQSMVLVTSSLADLAQSKKGPWFAMYEMWLNQIPGAASALQVQDAPLALEQTDPAGLCGAQEYRERIRALED